MIGKKSKDNMTLIVSEHSFIGWPPIFMKNFEFYKNVGTVF